MNRVLRSVLRRIKKAYIQTNKGDLDLIELQTLDLETGATQKVEGEPLGKVDQGSVTFSKLTHDIIATTYDDDRIRIVWHNKDYERDYNKIKKIVGDREINFQSSTADETKFVVSTNSDVDPGTVWTYDRKDGKLQKLYQVREKLDRNALRPGPASRGGRYNSRPAPAPQTNASANGTRPRRRIADRRINHYPSKMAALQREVSHHDGLAARNRTR